MAADFFSSFRAVDARRWRDDLRRGSHGRIGERVWAWDGSSNRLVLLTKAMAQFTNASPKTVNAVSLLDSVPNSSGQGRGHRAGEVALRLAFSDHTTGVAIAQFDGNFWRLTLLGVSGASTGVDGTWKTFGPLALAKPGSGASLAALNGTGRTSLTIPRSCCSTARALPSWRARASRLPSPALSSGGSPIRCAKC